MSSLMYHPMSRPLSQRDLLGCLTPSHSELEPEFRKIESNERQLSHLSNINLMSINEINHIKQLNHGIRSQLNKNEIRSQTSSSTKKSSHTPPISPPMSPCHSSKQNTNHITTDKSFLSNQLQFKIENFKDYKLTIEPWNNLDSSYKKSHLNFINQYQVEAEDYTPRSRTFKKRDYFDIDLDAEKMRTRRTPKPTYKVDSDSDLPVKKRKRNISPSSTATVVIDETIPDFSPNPLTTLPQLNVKCLKVEWKGQPMDLSQDPNLDKLHPSEAILASVLRLPAHIYLDSKRRLFFEKVQRFKTGKQFRRTDAQKACRIDVNKASRLFAAFEKVGWLEDKHFEIYK